MNYFIITYYDLFLFLVIFIQVIQEPFLKIISNTPIILF